MKIFRKILNHKKSLEFRSITAAFWTLFGKGGVIILNFARSIILTRLLFPEAFGVMAVVWSLIALIEVFFDFGLRPALIQLEKGDQREYIDTVWVIGITRNIILALLIVLLAPFIADLYDDPQLASVLRGVAVLPIIYGLSNPAVAIVVRNLSIHKIAIMELSTQFLGTVATAIIAYFLYSAWALVFGAILQNIFGVIFSYIIYPYRPRFKWNKEAAKSILSFAKFLLLNSILLWVAIRSDSLVIAKLFTLEIAAFYKLGFRLGSVFERVFQTIISRSYFPAISELVRNKSAITVVYAKVVCFAIMLITPILVTKALFAKEIVAILYDPRYQIVSISLFWISLRSIIRIVSNINEKTFIALGHPKFSFISKIPGVITLLFLPLAAKSYGLNGASCLILMVSVNIFLCELLLLSTVLKFPLKVLALLVLQIFLTSTATFFIFFYFSSLFPNHKILCLIITGISSCLSSLLIYVSIKKIGGLS